MEVFEMEKEFNDLMKKGQELLDKMKENHFADASKKVRWKPKVGEDYWFIRDYGIIDSTYFYDICSFDVMRYETGNCFQTREEVQKELDRRIAERELLDMCDGMNDEANFIIFYDVRNKFFSSCQRNYFFESIYRFKSMDSADKAIDTLGTEKLKLIFRID